MKASELRSIRRRLQLTQAEMARRLGISRNTLIRYETGKRPIPTMLELAARQLDQEG